MEDTNIKPIFDEEGLKANARIKVIGVGGGGSNAVNQMIKNKQEEVEYWVFNTDSQALANSPCENKLVLGRNVTKGLGAGGIPEMGRKAAEDSYEDIKLVVNGADMIFIAAGEGGGTGTGAAPIVAKASKEAGCLVLGIVTRPFTFEGKNRRSNALEGINELTKNVDALIVVSNDKLTFNNGSMTLVDAFGASDIILASSVSTVTDLILKHGIINLDFADVKSTLSGRGLALIGIGYGEGKDKAIQAATNAINSPLLEASIKGSRSMIINITVADDTTLDDVQYAINYITEAAGSNNEENDVNIIFGVQMDEKLHGKMKIAIIATDFVNKIDLSKTGGLPLKPHPISKPVPTENVEDISQQPATSRVEKEIKEKEESSVLPDYLKNLFAKKGSSDTSTTSDKNMTTDDKRETTQTIPVPKGDN